MALMAGQKMSRSTLKELNLDRFIDDFVVECFGSVPGMHPRLTSGELCPLSDIGTEAGTFEQAFQRKFENILRREGARENAAAARAAQELAEQTLSVSETETTAAGSSLFASISLVPLGDPKVDVSPF
jgi:hypothetical protein